MEISTQLRKLCLTQHKGSFQRNSVQRFTLVEEPKERHRSIDAPPILTPTNGTIKEGDREDSECELFDEQKEYKKMSKKLEEKRKMKVGTRNFNKSFYGKLAKKIVDKPISFYKFGLKEQEKRACKSVFTQLFKIEKQKLKGSLSVAQLWDNKTTMKYLKQNEMFFNKDILIQQFQSIDKEQKQKKRALQIQKQKQFVKKYRQMVLENRKLNQNNINYQQVREMDAKQACSFIRSQIDKLTQNKYRKQFRVKTSSRKIIAGLEKDYGKFDEIAWKFKNNMIVLL